MDKTKNAPTANRLDFFTELMTAINKEEIAHKRHIISSGLELKFK